MDKKIHHSSNAQVPSPNALGVEVKHAPTRWTSDDVNRIIDASDSPLPRNRASDAVACEHNEIIDNLVEQCAKLLEAGKLLCPIIGKFSISEGRVLVIGDNQQERLMTADESMNFHKGFSKLWAILNKAEAK